MEKEQAKSPEGMNDLSKWSGVFGAILGMTNIFGTVKDIAEAVILNKTNA